jgi:UDP-N-acetylmuramate dehydrogenase
MKDPFKKISGIKVLKNVVLSRYTSFHIGGNTDYFVRVYSKKALKNVLCIIKKRQLKYYLIGAGTNLLISDKGFRGVFIKLDGNFKKIKKCGDYFYCGAGALLDDFLKNTSKSGYGGAEFLVGIPGTIGGAVKGNAGAFGHALSEVTERITVINKDIEEEEVDNKDIGFDYRNSQIRNGVIIISAKIRLKKRKKKEILNTIRKNLKQRRRYQPTEYSAGSFFKNPSGYPAGKLIEECGLKGLRIGEAEVSRKHGNYIVNLGNAKASDVLKLAETVKRIVKKKKGIYLKEEVRILN